TVHGGILAVNVVSHLRLRHDPTHGGRGTGHGIAPKIGYLHFIKLLTASLAASSRLGCPEASKGTRAGCPYRTGFSLVPTRPTPPRQGRADPGRGGLPGRRRPEPAFPELLSLAHLHAVVRVRRQMPQDGEH